MPPAEHVHWMFATGFLLLALFLLAEVIVGEEVWRRRTWRMYLWPSFLFLMGVLMWPVMTFFTNSTIHMVAHGAWAQVMMLAGAAELGLVRGQAAQRALAPRDAVRVPRLRARVPRCTSRTRGSSSARRSCTTSSAGRWSSARCSRSRARSGRGGRSRTPVSRSCSSSSRCALFADRDLAPVFGHLSPLAGEPHR